MVSCHCDHGLAEYILCLSLRGLLMDWLELMGKRRMTNVGQRALLGALSRWGPGGAGAEGSASTELNRATWNTTLWSLSLYLGEKYREKS